MKKIVFIIFVLISIGIPVASQNENDKINKLEAERKKTLLDIENTTQLVNQLKKSTATLLERIKMTSLQIDSRKKVISLLNDEINSITREQRKAEAEIKTLEVELKKKKQNYADAIKGMIYKKQSKNRLIFVLSGRSFSESARRMKYLREYSEWRNNQAEEIEQQQTELEKKKESLEKTRKEKLALLAQHKDEQTKLASDEKKHQSEVSEANNKQKDLQTELKKKQQRANELNNQIERIIAEEVARQEREAKRIAEEAARLEREKKKGSGTKPETPGDDKTYTRPTTPSVTQKNLVLSNDFASNKGKFPMPVTGTARVVGRFGTHQHEIYRKVQVNSNGIDIQTSKNSEARTIFGGEVTRVLAIAGSNNGIIIRHGSYYTFYGNIQNVYVKVGQKVTEGQSIGKIYEDAEKGVTLMHFQLWRGTTKLNPEPWLKK